MTTRLSLNRESVRLTLVALHESATVAYNRGNITSIGLISTAVANLIGGTAFGGTEQRSVMDLASEVGFRPEYYGDSIRVHFEPATVQPQTGLPVGQTAKPRGELPVNTGKPWTPEWDAQVQAEFDKGTPTKDIAIAMGRTRWAVESRLIVLGRMALTEPVAKSRKLR